MIGFYGFDPAASYGYSRLFNPQLFQRAQQAYGQGMQMFTPYNPDDLRRIQEERRAAMAARNAQPAQSDFLKGIGENDVRQLSDRATIARGGNNNFQIGINTGRGQAQYLSVDEMGNLLDGQTIGRLSVPQFDAYNRLLAQLRSVNR